MNKLESLSPKEALCEVWLKLARWFWKRRFLNSVNIFSQFRNYLPLDKGGILHFYKVEFSSPKKALCQVWLKLDQLFCRRFLISSMFFFFIFHYYLHLEKGRVLHLNKLESSSPKDAMCQVWLKLDQWFWRRRCKCEKYTTMPTTIPTMTMMTTTTTTDKF